MAWLGGKGSGASHEFADQWREAADDVVFR